jgi:hypothetical protein
MGLAAVIRAAGKNAKAVRADEYGEQDIDVVESGGWTP